MVFGQDLWSNGHYIDKIECTLSRAKPVSK